MMEEPESSSQKVSVKHRFANFYFRHIARTANANAEQNKRLQIDTGRVLKRIIRIDVFEFDIQKRGLIDQERWAYYVRAVDGVIEFLREVPPKPDVRMMTDVRTLYGFSRGRIERRMTDGRWKVIEPFKPTDALRMGLLEVDGPGTALRDLMVLEREVFPSIAEDLKIKGYADEQE